MTAARTLARTSSKRRQLYGVAFACEGNANINIGQYSTPQKCSQRERMEHTGSIKNVKAYVKSGTGYSLGTGGTIRLEIQSDDGTALHGPSGSILAQKDLTPGNSTQVGQWDLTTPLPVTAGQLLHFVYRNVDASPTANYIAINGVELHNAPAQHQPYIDNLSRGLMVAYDLDPTPWAEQTDVYPILDVEFVDGYRQGQGFYQGDRVVGQKQINGTQNMVRMGFTPTAPRVVSNVNVYLFRQTGTTQPLIAELKNAGGTVLASATWAASEGSIGDLATGYGSSWLSRALSVPVALAASTTYYLQLRSPSETVPWIIFAIEGGGSATFGLAFKSSVFLDGMGLESTVNGGTLWTQYLSTVAYKGMAYFS